MRCYCCGVVLTDYELTMKGAMSKTYLDMCSKCVKIAGIAVLGGSVEEPDDTSYNIYEDPDYMQILDNVPFPGVHNDDI